MADKRQHPRICAPLTAFVTHGDLKAELPVRDISHGGLFLYGLEAEVGKVIGLSLAIPGGEEGVSLSAEVVRAVVAPTSSGGGLLGCGLQFLPMGAEQSQALARLMQRVMNGPGGERRAYPRIAHRLDVWCEGAPEMRAVLRDLSRTGASLWVHPGPAMGDLLHLEIDRPRGTSLKLSGKVVSAPPGHDAQPYQQVGLQFVNLTPELQSEIEAYLTELIKG